MLFLLPCSRVDLIDQQSFGKLIYNLNLVSKDRTCYKTEPSVVISNELFRDYRQTQVLPDGIISEIVWLLKHLHITRATLFMSFFEVCNVMDQPITIRVSDVNIRNALIALYVRWFDPKPYAKRKTRHLEEEDTYPAILIQSCSEDEQTTITRHPRTGALLRGADGIRLIHCADTPLDHKEEAMIKAVDSLIDLPGKIIYRRNPGDGEIIVRRVEEYHLTTQALLDCLLAKLESGAFSSEKFLSLLRPENIASVSSRGYCLTHDIQYRGNQVTDHGSVMGHACFPWTDVDKLTDDAIFISDDVTPGDAHILSKCHGAIFTSGGITHGSVMCRGMGIPCINRASGLEIDKWYNKAFTEDKREIHEGDIICILEDRWTLGGMLVFGEKYQAVCSRETMRKIRDVLAPFTEASKLEMLSVKEQIHISKLIKVMKGCGWLK